MLLRIETIGGNTVHKKSPDGGWGLVVIFASFFLWGIVFAVPKSLAVFFEDFKNDFNATNSEVSWISSSCFGILGIAAPFANTLIKKYDARKLMFFCGVLCSFGLFISAIASNIWIPILGGGVLFGIGFSWCIVSVITQLNIYFAKWRGVANGIAGCGSSLLSTGMPVLAQFLSTIYGWRGTMIIFAGITLNICVFAALVRPIRVLSKKEEMMYLCNRSNLMEPKESNESEQHNQWLDNSCLNSVHMFCKRYWIVGLIFLEEFLCSMVIYLPGIYTAVFSRELGCTEQQSAILLSMLSIGDIVCRPLAGVVLSMFPALEKRIMLCLAGLFFIQIFVSLSGALSYNFINLLIYSLLYGCVYGLQITCIVSSVPILVGVDNVQSITGSKFFTGGLAALIGPPIAGKLSDVYGSYRVVYWFSIVFFFLGGAISILIDVMIQRFGAVMPEHRRKEDIATDLCY